VTGTPTPALHPWSKDALLTKALRYAEGMLANPRDEWGFVFWSTLTLELLARAALANVSPALLADSKADWRHLYFALGKDPKTAKYVPRSIDIIDVFARLRESIDDFQPRLEEFSRLHLARRNEELHTGGTPFDGVPQSAWLPIFFESCEVLLASMGETLGLLLGADEAKAAKEMIAAARDEAAKAVGKTIEAHRTVWTGTDAAERARLAAQGTAWAAKHAGHRTICPSCGSDALLTGSAVAPPVKTLRDEVIIETQYILPSRFECVACGLKISGLPQLSAAGLGDQYKATFEYDAAEYYAPEDRYEGYEPDYNEP